MPRLVFLVRQTRDPGTFESAWEACPQNMQTCTFRISRDGWSTRTGSPPDSIVVFFEAEMRAGGRTIELGGIGMEGGDLFHYATGDLGLDSTMTIRLPEPRRTDRELRVRIQNRNRVECQVVGDVE